MRRVIKSMEVKSLSMRKWKAFACLFDLEEFLFLEQALRDNFLSV